MTLMKKILGVTGVALASITFLAACSSSSSSSSSSSGKEEVVFATVGTTAPFSYEEDGELTGYDIEVAKAVPVSYARLRRTRINFGTKLLL